ncbi:uncharacterized protein [Aegilops tauschii subsp. strangulata]|uniref:uncharacterized protein n=1 Tax=Aegilops tauschii subsp. strangulata TaxID=200361 RepID=UPI003CC8B055
MVAPDDDSALKWAREDYVREQVRRQRRAYLETQARSRAEERRRVAEEGGVIIIDSDNEGEAGPSTAVGDPGEGCSRHAGEARGNNDGDDYTRFYRLLGGDPLAQSAGFWIDWDEGSKTGIVLTTAHLIRANKPLPKDYWAKKDRHQYHPGAQVTAHLLDDTTAEGRLLYHEEHYDLAFFRIAMDQSVQLASFADTFNSGQQALRLGRDGNLILRITHGKAMQDDDVYFCRDKKYECDNAGEPVIDFDGKVVGMINDCKSVSFVPFFILNRCMELWRNFGCIPRPHLGLQFKALKFLDPSHVEYIWRKLNIDDSLLVEELSMGSHAEKVGIRVGDIIGSIDGERISTRIELEKKLLSISMGSFNGGNDINAKVDISL